MFKFHSLTVKFIFMGSILLVFIAAYITATYIFTHHMEGEAKRVNLAGRERMLFVDIARQQLEIADTPPSEERTNIIEQTKQDMIRYEEVLFGLRDGSEKHGLSPIHSHAKDAVKQNNKLIEMWQKVQKPEIERLMNMPDKRKAREFNQIIDSYIEEIDKLVTLIEKHTEKEIKDFDVFRYYTFGFFFIGAGFIIFYIRQSIIKPVRRLKDAAQEIEKGDFDVKVDVKTSDDIGALGSAFNNMAQTLDVAFDENIRLIENRNALYDSIKDIMGEPLVDRLLEKIVDRSCRLIGCKYAAIGILNEKGAYEHFVPSGIDEQTFEGMMKRHGLAKGKGLLGHLLKEGKPVRIDDISRHPSSIGFPEGHPPMKTFLGVPVVLHDKVIGRLYFAEKHPRQLPPSPSLIKEGERGGVKGGIEGGFTQEDEDLAMSFASTVALAINNARMVSDLKGYSEALFALNQASNSIIGITKA